MDILQNKRYANFSYTSRYTGIPYYHNTLDDRDIYGIGSNMKKDIPYAVIDVKATDTLDGLALRYYNNPTFWWVIAFYNNIWDSLINLNDYYTTLKIPNIASIEFGLER